MHSFSALAEQFARRFARRIFPEAPANLYDPAQYILGLGGKRLRPVLCLMGGELFDEIQEDAYAVAAAIELFHNFTLVHDDIMDEAPLRRGQPAVHHRFGLDSALLAGDVLLVYAYEQLNQIGDRYLKRISGIFSRTAREVCEGQQLDMDYEALPLAEVDMQAYLQMISLKTSVLLAGSLQMGGILGGATEENLDHLYAFGKDLGIAFQIHDDYLDAFGDPEKFGKQPGGDILENKKTFLLLKAWEQADPTQRAHIGRLLAGADPDKVGQMLQVYRDCRVDAWAVAQKDRCMESAAVHLDHITVPSARKAELRSLIGLLLDRES